MTAWEFWWSFVRQTDWGLLTQAKDPMPAMHKILEPRAYQHLQFKSHYLDDYPFGCGSYILIG